MVKLTVLADLGNAYPILGYRVHPGYSCYISEKEVIVIGSRGNIKLYLPSNTFRGPRRHGLDFPANPYLLAMSIEPLALQGQQETHIEKRR